MFVIAWCKRTWLLGTTHIISVCVPGLSIILPQGMVSRTQTHRNTHIQTFSTNTHGHLLWFCYVRSGTWGRKMSMRFPSFVPRALLTTHIKLPVTNGTAKGGGRLISLFECSLPHVCVLLWACCQGNARAFSL